MWWWKWRDEYRGGCIPHPPLYKKHGKIGGIEDSSRLSSKNFTPWPAIDNTQGAVLGGVVVKAAIPIAARAREFCLVGQRPEWAAWVGALQVAVGERGCGGVLVGHGKAPWLAHKSYARTYETL